MLYGFDLENLCISSMYKHVYRQPHATLCTSTTIPTGCELRNRLESSSRPLDVQEYRQSQENICRWDCPKLSPKQG